MLLQLMSSHGMLTILEVLKGKSRDAIMRLLHIVNLLVMSDFAFVESFCLVGGIPVMMVYTPKRYRSDVAWRRPTSSGCSAAHLC